MEQKKKIEYIDALRGFTMILVVINHIIILSAETSSYINQILQTFRMPLFFFISGYIAFKANKIHDIKSYTHTILNKCKVQIIPTLVFGLLYTYATLNENFNGFIMHNSKYGYWFTISLLEMFIMYYTIKLIQKSSFAKKIRGGETFVLICPAAILWTSRYILVNIPIYTYVSSILCLEQTFLYFPFFIFGVIISSHSTQVNNIIDKTKYCLSFIIVAFAALTLFNEHFTNNPNFYTNVQYLPIGGFVKLALGALGIIITFTFFRRYQNIFTKQTRIGYSLQYIGQRTLDIYLLHYFFLPDLSKFKYFFGTETNIIGFFVCIGLSLIIISASLIISNIIRTSPILAHYLFGVKME